jgi:hypothetical protein
MALDSKNNIKSVFIVPAASAVTTGTKMVPGATPTGSVVITNMSNVVLTTGTGTNGVQNYSKIKIIKDRGANLPLQQVILDLADVKAVSAISGAPSTEQVSYIGYNGTTGNIQVLASNFYTIKLEHVPNAFAYGKRPANYKYGTYQSPLGLTQNSAGQANIANGLVASLVQNFVPNRSTDWKVKSELVISDTTTAFGATTATSMVFTKYSKAVTVNTGAAGVTIAAGTYLRLGATTSTTSPVYRVATGAVIGATSSGTIVLEVAYQGDTSTITVAGGVTFIVTPAGDFGIKITGLKQQYDVNRWRQYDKVRFNVLLDGFPNTATPTAVTTTAAFDGIGVYEQAANDEYISWGDEGQVFVDQVPPLFREQDAASGTQYSPAVISWLNELPSLIGAGENKGQVILYFAGALVAGVFTPAVGTQANIVSVFNSWRASSFPATNWPDVVV